MHKGYTINYFINFFTNIPNSKWTTGEFQEPGTEQFCALGHCLRHGSTYNTEIDNQHAILNAKARALDEILNNQTWHINDGAKNDGHNFKELGKTPRARILKALRNRKRGFLIQK